jgi:hypothetical protein
LLKGTIPIVRAQMRLKVVYYSADVKKIKEVLKNSNAETESEEIEGDEHQLVITSPFFILLFFFFFLSFSWCQQELKQRRVRS